MRVHDKDEGPTDPIASTAIFRVQLAVHVFGSCIEMAGWIPNDSCEKWLEREREVSIPFCAFFPLTALASSSFQTPLRGSLSRS